MDGREVVEPAGQECERDGQATRRAHQVQPPAEELLALGGAVPAVPAVGAPAHRAAAPRPHTLAHGDGHAVDDEIANRGLPVGEQVTEHVEEQGQPVGQRVQAAREARRRERPREVARRAQDGARTGAVVPAEGCRDHRHRPHLRVAHPSQLVASMPQGTHRLLDYHVNPYNVRGSHRLSPFRYCLSTTVKRVWTMTTN